MDEDEIMEIEMEFDDEPLPPDAPEIEDEDFVDVPEVEDEDLPEMGDLPTDEDLLAIAEDVPPPDLDAFDETLHE